MLKEKYRTVNVTYIRWVLIVLTASFIVTLLVAVVTGISLAEANNTIRNQEETIQSLQAKNKVLDDMVDSLQSTLYEQTVFLTEKEQTVQEYIPVEYGAGNSKEEKQTIEICAPELPANAVSLGSFRVTHYCTCAICCGVETGITSSGRAAQPGYSIAVDPFVIPLGSTVLLDYGDGVLHEYRADDTGGAVDGNIVDVCVADHQTAIDFGVRTASVYLCSSDLK